MGASSTCAIGAPGCIGDGDAIRCGLAAGPLGGRAGPEESRMQARWLELCRKLLRHGTSAPGRAAAPRKVVSFSLWGEKAKYTIGALRNAELRQQFYPDWIARFYVGTSVPPDIIARLEARPGTEVKLMPEPGDLTATFWRFRVAYDDAVDVAIFRDTDSRPSAREKAAVDAWLASGKTFHIMRDHPWHNAPIMGGMWGCRRNPAYNLRAVFEGWKPEDRYQTDQDCLKLRLFPLIGGDKLVHDEFFEHIPFPTPRKGKEFVGEVFDEHDQHDPKLRTLMP